VLLTNGRVHTTDAASSIVDSLVIRDGRVAFAGRRGDLNPAAGEATLDLGGRTVLPGLVDGHGHLMLLAKAGFELDLISAGSEEEIAGMVGAAAARRSRAPTSHATRRIRKADASRRTSAASPPGS